MPGYRSSRGNRRLQFEPSPRHPRACSAMPTQRSLATIVPGSPPASVPDVHAIAKAAISLSSSIPERPYPMCGVPGLLEALQNPFM
ncbi:hypothetical protein ZEAMMB73_Zm00001d005339 [Zea mays]|uniref:Uncharacterized protein n=1 Tax=Zea mays TaxID=4577 RepID=A0A1D6ELV9_MAIZE|nr:hypothetical protein ZEAMMB73_Zm00001d005339 [Zea mays]ONM20868.1 hypothetical protein ZEAMMB73_Zm00001d005339 [Zea mays]